MSSAPRIQGPGRPRWRVRPGIATRSAAIVGWGATGDSSGLSRSDILEAVADVFPDFSNTQRSVAVSTLFRFARAIAQGDLILTPEPTTRTILFGRVSEDYFFLGEALDRDDNYRHARGIRWFARVDRDELSYGARNSLGSLLALHPANACR